MTSPIPRSVAVGRPAASASVESSRWLPEVRRVSNDKATRGRGGVEGGGLCRTNAEDLSEARSGDLGG